MEVKVGDGYFPGSSWQILAFHNLNWNPILARKKTKKGSDQLRPRHLIYFKTRGSNQMKRTYLLNTFLLKKSKHKPPSHWVTDRLLQILSVTFLPYNMNSVCCHIIILFALFSFIALHILGVQMSLGGEMCWCPHKSSSSYRLSNQTSLLCRSEIRWNIQSTWS